jgi:hypothetical protein
MIRSRSAAIIWVLGEHRLMCGDSGSRRISTACWTARPSICWHATRHIMSASNRAAAPPSPPVCRPSRTRRRQLHHQSFDQARGVTDPKKARKKMRAKDRPLENDFVSDEAFDQMLLAWFG